MECPVEKLESGQQFEFKNSRGMQVCGKVLGSVELNGSRVAEVGCAAEVYPPAGF